MTPTATGDAVGAIRRKSPPGGGFFMPCERAKATGSDQNSSRGTGAAEIVWVRDKSIEDARMAGEVARFFLMTVRLA